MRGDEARVVDAFGNWLRQRGWLIEEHPGLIDLVATRNGQHLYAEAKGRTTEPGLDIDTLYGQLLRRIPPVPVSSSTHLLAVVVPDTAVKLAQRVPLTVREALNIHIYGVDSGGTVDPAGDRPDPTH